MAVQIRAEPRNKRRGPGNRYPRIRWVLGHLGGTIPYLAERLDRGYRAFKECRVHIDEPPTAYLKRHFYYDTVNFDPGALKLAIEFARRRPHPGRSDYPHQIGSIPLTLESLLARRLDFQIDSASWRNDTG